MLQSRTGLPAAVPGGQVAACQADGRLVRGTWQQIVVLNLDNRAREREVVAVVTGD